MAAATGEAQRRDEAARETRRKKEVRDQAITDTQELSALRDRLQKAQQAASKLSGADMESTRPPLDDAGRAVVAVETIRSMIGRVGGVDGSENEGDNDNDDASGVNEDFAR